MKTNHFSLFVVFVAMLMVGSSAKAQTIPKASDPVCAYCGVKLKTGEPHKPGCKYHTGTASSTSSTGTSHSTYRQSPAYTTTEAATTALGTLLSGLVEKSFSGNSQKKAEKKAQEQRDVAIFEKTAEKKTAELAHDKQFWTFGDYHLEVVDSQVCIINTKRGKYITAPIHFSDVPDPKNPPKNLFAVTAYKGNYDFPNSSRIRFLDSSKEDISPELDGYLLLRMDRMWYYSKNKQLVWTETGDIDAVGRVVADTLQIVMKYKIWRPFDEWKDSEGRINFAKIDFESCFEPLGTLPYFVHMMRRVIYPLTKQQSENEYKVYYIFDRTGNVVAKEVNSFEVLGDYACVKYHSGETKFYDSNFQEVPALYEDWAKSNIEGMGKVFIVKKNGSYGVVNDKGKTIIPFIYNDIKSVDATLLHYKSVSYTLWYANKAAEHINKKGEFEKQAHFDARMKDAKLQEEYLREQMQGSETQYIQKMLHSGVRLTLGKYDAEKETFPVFVIPAPWNSFSLPVPIAEAEAFKASFDEIKEAALKGAVYDIRNDAIGIREITFKLPSGKTFTAKVQ